MLGLHRPPLPFGLALALLAGVWGMVVASPSAAHGAPDATTTPNAGQDSLLAISGLKLIAEADLRSAIGELPARLDRAAAGKALEAALAYCRGKGYSYARGWVVGPLRPSGSARRRGTADSGSSSGPRYRLEIDEGYLDRITFVGANTLRILILRVEVYLPKKVFHRPTLDTILTRLKERYHLKKAYVKVREIGPEMRAPDGGRTPRRELRVYFVSEQLDGWGLGISLSSTYGVVPSVSYSERTVFVDDDRLSAVLGVGFPYRQYLFAESPELTWVHGFAHGRYRLPRLVSGRLAPALEGEYSMSRLQRADLIPPIDRYLLNRGGLMAQLELKLSTLSLELGVGWTNTTTWDLETPPETPTDTYSRVSIDAFVTRLRARIDTDSGPQRADLRTLLSGELSAEIAEEQWLVRGQAFGQYARCLGYHCLLLRARGTVLLGEVGFWNQRPLGEHLRVFFDNRFWIEEALSFTAAVRIGLWTEKIQLGAFHDLATFGDRRDPKDVRVAVANAFGPSLHVLLVDVFSLDIYYGFGFAPGGFDHNLSFSLQRVF